jgi:lysylphosphatidylglycerol synthetase-like protein (DUF2156 family)
VIRNRWPDRSVMGDTGPGGKREVYAFDVQGDTVSRWNRFGAQLYRHGEHYSDFNELRRAKARFAPRWDPRFVSSRPGLALARAIPDLAKLVAGSSTLEAARKT